MQTRLILLIIILCLFDIYLLYSNSKLKQEKYNLEMKVEGLNLEVVNFKSELPKLPLKEIGFIDKDLNLLVVFTDYGCGGCMADFVHHLNKLYNRNKFNENIKIYFAGLDSTILERLGAKFPVLKVPENLIKENRFNVKQPFSILFNKNWEILLGNIAVPGQDFKNEKYFNAVESIFTLVLAK